MIYRPINVLSCILVLLATQLLGCSMPFINNNNPEKDFARYVEDVFRLQNSVTSEIMALQENDEFNDNSGLLKAEQNMREACAALNEYVAKETDGDSISFFLRQRVQKSAIACEDSAKKVNLKLNRL